MVVPWIAIAAVIGARGVDGVDIGVVVDVEVNWVDANDGTVLFVELFDFPDVLPLVGEDFVVEFVPEG